MNTSTSTEAFKATFASVITWFVFERSVLLSIGFVVLLVAVCGVISDELGHLV